jgi:hypothetical protein
MSDGIWSLVTGVVIVAIVFMLVRPGSPGANAIADVSSALTALVTTAAGTNTNNIQYQSYQGVTNG